MDTPPQIDVFHHAVDDLGKLLGQARILGNGAPIQKNKPQAFVGDTGILRLMDRIKKRPKLFDSLIRQAEARHGDIKGITARIDAFTQHPSKTL